MLTIVSFPKIEKLHLMTKAIDDIDRFRVSSILMFSMSGTKIITRYYDKAIPEPKRAQFENEIFQRGIEDQLAEVMQHDEFIAIYHVVHGVFIFVVATLQTNELFLLDILTSIQSVINIVFKDKVSADILIKQIDLLYLILDETLEQGFLMESDPHIIAARAQLKGDSVFTGND